MLKDELDVLYGVFLRDSRLARDGVLNQRPMTEMVDAHHSGLADHGNRLWLLLNSEVWYRFFIRGESEGQVADEIAAGVKQTAALSDRHSPPLEARSRPAPDPGLASGNCGRSRPVWRGCNAPGSRLRGPPGRPGRNRLLLDL